MYGDTYTTIKAAAISISDMENSSFISDTEWERWCNQGMNRLYDLLVRAYEGYFEAETTFATVADQEDYDLPDTFYKLLSVDVQIATNEWLALKPYQASDRNKYNRNWNYRYTPKNLRAYRVIGDSLRLRPLPSSVETVRVRYIPIPTPIVSGGNENLPNRLMEYWSEHIVLHMAIAALRKEESDTKALRQEMAVVEQSIRAAAAERNVGDVLTVADVRGVDADGDIDWGFWAW